jgi:hypothetical protein
MIVACSPAMLPPRVLLRGIEFNLTDAPAHYSLPIPWGNVLGDEFPAESGDPGADPGGRR